MAICQLILIDLQCKEKSEAQKTRNHNKHLVNSGEANILTVIEIQRVNAAICFLDNGEQHPVEEKKHRKGFFNEIGGIVYMTKVTQ